MVENPLSEFARKDIPGLFNEVNVLRQHKTRVEHALNNDTILPPYEIIIHPAAGCNLHCDWCIGGRVLEDQEAKWSDLLPSTLVNPDNMERLITGVVNYRKEGFRVENISFSGITGEPLVAKQSFVRAVDILKEEGIRVGLFSNAVLIDEEIIEALLKIDYINISLDAGTPETYANLKYGGRPQGKILFERLLGNIDRLVKARNESPNSNLQVNSSFVLYPDNYQEIHEAASTLKRLGVGTLRMKQDISGRKMLSPEQKEEARQLLERVDGLVDDNFKFVKIHQFGRPADMQRLFHKCVITDLMAAIGSDGNVYPCNYNATLEGAPYGNAIDHSFEEIWEGETRRQIKNQIPSICPPYCDPFKTRANNLLQAVSDSQDKHGVVKTQSYIQEIIDVGER